MLKDITHEYQYLLKEMSKYCKVNESEIIVVTNGINQFIAKKDYTLLTEINFEFFQFIEKTDIKILNYIEIQYTNNSRKKIFKNCYFENIDEKELYFKLVFIPKKSKIQKENLNNIFHYNEICDTNDILIRFNEQKNFYLL